MAYREQDQESRRMDLQVIGVGGRVTWHFMNQAFLSTYAGSARKT